MRKRRHEWRARDGRATIMASAKKSKKMDCQLLGPGSVCGLRPCVVWCDGLMERVALCRVRLVRRLRRCGLFREGVTCTSYGRLP